MPHPEKHPTNGPMVYDTQHIIGNEHTGNLSLHVHIGGQDVYLPLILTPEGKTICYLNPQETSVREAGVDYLVCEIEQWVAQNNTRYLRVLTPRSHKSEQMVTEVRDELSKKRVCNLTIDMFPKANSKKELHEQLGEDALIVSYSPITKKSRYIGISQENARLLRHDYVRGVTFILVDDVVSSGATIEALKKLLGKVFQGTEFKANELSIFAVMLELPVDMQPPTDGRLHYAGVLPVLSE